MQNGFFTLPRSNLPGDIMPLSTIVILGDSVSNDFCHYNPGNETTAFVITTPCGHDLVTDGLEAGEMSHSC